MRSLSLVCVSLVVLTFTSQAQELFKLTGSVVNSVTGEPVRGAMVQISGQASRSIMTGSDGHFEADSLPGAAVVLSATRPGFAMNTNWQQVALNSSTPPVIIKLKPNGSIGGRIADRDGEPIEGINVHCVQETIVMGRKQSQTSGSGTTDDAGRFLIEDLPAGSYTLYTETTVLYPGTQPKSEAARFVYPKTFFPDSQTSESAQKIELAPGAEMKIDFTLKTARAVRITFTTIPPFRFVMGSFIMNDEQPNNEFAQPDPATGMLILNAVTPGSGKLVVRGPFGPGAPANQIQLYGEVPLEIGTHDLDNLKVPLNRLPGIQATVTGGASNSVYVTLASRNGEIGGSWPNQNGTLQIPAVTPGSYRVSIQPETICVASITSGSQDLLHDELTVTAGASVPPLQIAIGKNCPQLSIRSNSGKMMWAVVTGAKGFQARLAMLPEQGFTFPVLPEGEYNVYVFDDASNLEYTNPEAMRSFKSKTVTLEAGQKVSVQPEANLRGQQ